jgi:hypothetical protein
MKEASKITEWQLMVRRMKQDFIAFISGETTVFAYILPSLQNAMIQNGG